MSCYQRCQRNSQEASNNALNNTISLFDILCSTPDLKTNNAPSNGNFLKNLILKSVTIEMEESELILK